MRARAALIAAGVLTMGYAAGGALADPGLDLGGVLVFLAAVLIGHDTVWMPAVLATGAAVTRVVPRRHRPAVRIAAISAAAVAFVAVPLVLGFGRPADNPSALPLPYGRNLAVVLLGVAGVLLLTRPRRRKNSERRDQGGAGPASG
jgi:hypothetical protein